MNAPPAPRTLTIIASASVLAVALVIAASLSGAVPTAAATTASNARLGGWDDWSGAGGGWYGGSGSWSTWQPQSAQQLRVRDLHIDRGTISPNGDGTADDVTVSLRLARTSTGVRVSIRDARDATVRELGDVTQPGSTEELTWDGRDGSGTTAPDGTYRIVLEALHADGSVDAATHALDLEVGVDTTVPGLEAKRPSLVQVAALAKRAAKLAAWQQEIAKYRRHAHASRHHQHRNPYQQQWEDAWRAQQLQLPVTFTTSEAGSIAITTSVAGKQYRMQTWREAGTHTVKVPIATYQPGATLAIELTTSDDAGNTRTHTIAIKLPALPKLKPRNTGGGGGSGGGGTTTPPTTTVPTGNGPLPDWLDPIMLKATYAAGVPQSWARSKALANILQHESSFRPTAQNPTSTAYGLFQFLDQTWATVGCKKTSDAYQQSVCGLRYIERRYHTPEAAWSFWQAHNWY